MNYRKICREIFVCMPNDITPLFGVQYHIFTKWSRLELVMFTKEVLFDNNRYGCFLFASIGGSCGDLCSSDRDCSNFSV